jgi:hypothetical protein
MRRIGFATGLSAVVLTGCGAPSSTVVDCRSDPELCAILGIAAVGLVLILLNEDGSTSYVVPK